MPAARSSPGYASRSTCAASRTADPLRATRQPIEADCPAALDHVRLFESDEGLERKDEALQYLLEALGLGQGRHPAQQGLRLLAVSGLPLPATHQLHQRGLQFVTKGFEFAIAYHLESSTVSALEEDYARHHEVAVCQLTMG